MRPASRLCVCIAAILLSSSGARAQLSRVGDEISCSECSIELRDIAVLGRFEDPTSPKSISEVARTPDGHFFVIPTYMPGVVAEYDGSGGFIRTLGRPGQGPGEFTTFFGPRIISGADGALHVFNQARHTRLDPANPGNAQLHTLEIPPLAGAAILSGGRFIVSRGLRNPLLGSYPLHLFDANGDHIRSFGPDLGPEVTGYERLMIVGPAGEDRVWASPVAEYKPVLYDTMGNTRTTLARDARWFTPWDDPRGENGIREPPRPQVHGLREDAAGLLWTIVRVSDENWKPFPSDGPIFIEELFKHPRFDTLIEVMDPRTGRVIQRARFDEQLTFVQGPARPVRPLVHAPTETEQGLIQLRVSELRLKTPRD